MNYHLQFPSLRRLSTVVVGSLLLNQRLTRWNMPSQVKNTKSNKRLPEEFENLNVFKKEICKMLFSIELPNLLKSEVCDVVMQLYFQTWDWIEYCAYYHLAESKQLYEVVAINQIFFTVQGEIDKKKMLEADIEEIGKQLQASGDFDICNWFKVACGFCLEDWIQQIWSYMTNYERAKIHANSRGDHLVSYWLCYVTIAERAGELVSNSVCRMDLVEYEEHMFDNLIDYTLQQGKMIAAEYFWHRFTDTEKRRRALQYAGFAVVHRVTNLLCSVLNCLEKEEQLQLMHQHASSVLQCFLKWPYDNHFLDVLELLWSSLNSVSYVYVLGEIIDKIPNDCELSNRFLNILHEYWSRSPVSLKQSLSFNIMGQCLLALKVKKLQSVSETSYQRVVNDYCWVTGWDLRL